MLGIPLKDNCCILTIYRLQGSNFFQNTQRSVAVVAAEDVVYFYP